VQLLPRHAETVLPDGCASATPRGRLPGPLDRGRRLALLFAVLSSAAFAQAPVDFTHLPALESPVITDALLLDVTRAGDRLVAVGENGFVIFSDDAGNSWEQASVPLSVTLTTVTFVTARLGWAGGHEGVLLISTDGGESWTQRFDGLAATRQEIALAEEKLAEARERLAAPDGAGQDDEAAMMLEDAQWALEDLQTALQDGPSKPFLDVWFGSAEEGIAAGAYGYLFRSSDGGETWRLAARDIDNPYNYHYYGIDRARDGTLYLAGEAGLLYRSPDGGRAWETLDSPYEGSFFGVLTGAADGEDFVLVFGLRGNVFRSADGGDQWRRIDAGTEASLMAGATLPDGRIVLVGNSGAVVISEDGGRSFTATYREDRNSLSGVVPADEAHLVVVGAGGVHRIPVPAPEGTAGSRR
jgi:photosystem II stability/assembly factor-like uncharacterized protein